MVYKFFDRKSRGTTTYAGTGTISEDQESANEFHRSITKVYLPNRDNIWSAELAGMQLISKQNNKIGGSDSCCVLLIFTAIMLRFFY